MNFPITVILDPKNKFNNRLYFGNRLVMTGSRGLEAVTVRQINNGKRTAVELLISDFNLTVENNDCPELYRYSKIAANLGDREGLDQLRPVCDMIKMSPNACDGCPRNPSK